MYDTCDPKSLLYPCLDKKKKKKNTEKRNLPLGCKSPWPETHSLAIGLYEMSPRPGNLCKETHSQASQWPKTLRSMAKDRCFLILFVFNDIIVFLYIL
jgi:hypothetical protein